MAILIAALAMATAMMGAAFYGIYVEQRREMFRQLRASANRGTFAETN